MENLDQNQNNADPVKNQDRYRIILSLLITLVLAGGLFFHYNSTGKKLEEYPITRFYMDTYVEVNIVTDDAKKAMEAREAAFGIFASLEKEFNLYKPESLLNKVNQQSEWTLEDENFLKLLNLGMDYSRKTEGAFDMTMGAVRMLYPIGKENPVPPEKAAIEKALAVSGYKRMSFIGNRLEKPKDLIIDTGGILKGYAVDLAIDQIKKLGITDALVNGGGNIKVIGRNVNGEPWKIGVQNPRIPEKIIAVLPLDNEAVATSGDYQRYFFYKNIRYHHIMDPATGEPAMKAISATVIGPDAVMADAYSTAVFVMGKKKGLEFLNKEKLQGIIIDEDGAVMTEGLRGKVQLDYKGSQRSDGN